MRNPTNSIQAQVEEQKMINKDMVEVIEEIRADNIDKKK